MTTGRTIAWSPNALIAVISILAAALVGCSDPAEPERVVQDLVYVSPEDAGYSSEQLEAAAEALEGSGFLAVMAASGGRVFFSWGETDRNLWCHSIRKPFLCSLIGIETAGGVIDTLSSVGALGVDDIPPSLTDIEKGATIRDLLMSRSGIYHEAAAETQEMSDARPVRGSHLPGTFFYYNNWDFNALGTIYEQATGRGIFDSFDELIAGPIGMEDFSPENCYYQYEPAKSEHPAYSFRMSARDMLRFGILYEQDGRWGDRQIVPREWIKVSTAPYSLIEGAGGVNYGYMWYVFPKDPS